LALANAEGFWQCPGLRLASGESPVIPAVKKVVPFVRRRRSASTAALHGRVYAELRNALMSGRFAPGSLVSLRMLASLLGTSPMPVRAAINRLIAEQALEMRANRTVAVPILTHRQFLDLTELRILLEGRAARLAARNTNDALLKTLADLSDRAAVAGQRQQMQVALRLNRDFHFTLYAAAESQMLQQMIEMLWLQAGPLLHLTLAETPARWNGQHHFEILDALREQDLEGVARGIKADISVSSDYILSRGRFIEVA
jgi:DNA-binding GntR family transcriptional regulator